MEHVERIRAKHQECLARAKKMHRLHQAGLRRLKSFSLWKRVVARKRFAGLRLRIDKYKWDRFAMMSIAMSLSRSIINAERQRKRRR